MGTSSPPIFNVFVPTSDTKVTEYLCSGWVFLLQTNFDFLTSHLLSGDLFRLRIRSKLVEGSLFAIIYSLLEAKFITLYFIWRVGEDNFHKKSQIRKKNSIYLIFFTLRFSRYHCFIDHIRQSEHSGLCPDTSSLVQFCYYIKPGP